MMLSLCQTKLIRSFFKHPPQIYFTINSLATSILLWLLLFTLLGCYSHSKTITKRWQLSHDFPYSVCRASASRVVPHEHQPTVLLLLLLGDIPHSFVVKCGKGATWNLCRFSLVFCPTLNHIIRSTSFTPSSFIDFFVLCTAQCVCTLCFDERFEFFCVVCSLERCLDNLSCEPANVHVLRVSTLLLSKSFDELPRSSVYQY